MDVIHVQAYASPFQKSWRQVLGWLFQHNLINSSKEHSQNSSTNGRWELNLIALTLLNSCLPGKAVLNNIMCMWSMRNGWLSHNRQHDGHQKREISRIWRNSGKKNNTYSVKEPNSPAHCVGVFSLKANLLYASTNIEKECSALKINMTFFILLLS